MSSFGARVIVDGLRIPFEGNAILHQIAEVGCKSLPLVVPAGFALGTVMTFHTRNTLMTFGAGAMIPTVQALAFFVEIGPLVAGLLLAGRVGSGNPRARRGRCGRAPQWARLIFPGTTGQPRPRPLPASAGN